MEHLDILDDASEWLSFQPERLRTHSDKCHSWHPVCLVSRLYDEIKKLREINDLLGATIVFKDMTIRELKRLVDAADPPARWIPLRDSKPDEYKTVMVCHKGKVYCGGLRHPDSETPWEKSWWMLFKYSHPSREWADGAFVDESDCWMPLPDPPEAK